MPSLKPVWLSTQTRQPGFPVALDGSGNLFKNLSKSWNLIGPAETFALSNPLPETIGGLLYGWDGIIDIVAKNMEILNGYWVYAGSNGVQFNLAR